MAIALITIILLIILVMIAIKIGLNRERIEEEAVHPVIHASGIYSIVKKSPRENIHDNKPSREEIIQYLDGINEDINGLPLSDDDKKRIVERWEESMEENVASIDQGDSEGIEFYYYDFVPQGCPVCLKYFSRGTFVTRENIFSSPAIIPPLHLGCTARLRPHHGKENLRDTTEIGMLPLFKDHLQPPIPDWKTTLKPDTV